ILFTNGLLLDSEILGKLNVNEIQISIDGLNEAHDFIRGKGTYEKSIEAVKMVAGTSFQVSVSTMVHTRNLNDFDEMGRIFSEIGVRDWSVDVPCIAGFLKDNPDIVPPPDVAGKYLRYGFGEGLHGGGAGYVCGLHLMSVMADGRAAKCSFYSEDPVGHIGEGLEICWKRVEHAPLSDLDCNCAHLDTCRGGCRYRASLSGNARSGDPYRCAAFLGSD
ncbi:MAG TPA: radical SAM protein, partial [Nitrospirae bacterium]|nr:radical SAM protein [Nitrospirota bacterium]